MPNDIRAVAATVERVLAAGGLAGLAAAAPSAGCGGGEAERLADAADALRLALTEALNNVVEHGGGPAVSPLVRLLLWLDGSALTVCIEDSGPPAPDDLGAASASLADAPLSEGCPIEALPEGGWGLLLIAASVDRVHRHRHQGWNRLFLEKVLPPCACRA